MIEISRLKFNMLYKGASFKIGNWICYPPVRGGLLIIKEKQIITHLQIKQAKMNRVLFEGTGYRIMEFNDRFVKIKVIEKNDRIV